MLGRYHPRANARVWPVLYRAAVTGRFEKSVHDAPRDRGAGERPASRPMRVTITIAEPVAASVPPSPMVRAVQGHLALSMSCTHAGGQPSLWQSLTLKSTAIARTNGRSPVRSQPAPRSLPLARDPLGYSDVHHSLAAART